ncbi:Sphingosine kinase, involved in sphingolipid metabolism [Handroanthus impetiginosus]|uniref:sphingosine kinase n=1 Tax=Handroanthus impetiginosus TaxID=429701 RepID=A0A2G9GZW6_9LAMI|nr:Sphingosine kinase, involved in sphingolipid metabolism [Handroanthus impetiginosus]
MNWQKIGEYSDTDHMETEESILSDQVRANGDVTTATLSAGGQLRWAGRRLEMEKEVLGFSVEGSKIKIRAVVEAAGGTCCFSGKSNLIRKTFTLEFLSHDSLCRWTQKLQEYLDSLGRPKRLFIFVNPFGGKRFGSKIFVNDVKPLLDDANVDYTVQETKYQLHAKEVVQSLDLAKYDGIVCVSGDGILVEVLNGLLTRKDWDNAIRIPLGAVPAGTGNGMVKSLLDSCGEPCSPSYAMRSIIRGHKCSLDIATITQGDTKFFSMLMLAWGLVADIDIESEKYRWMGSARIDFYAVQRIFGLRKYNGSILFVPASGYESYGESLDLENEIIVEGESEIKPDDESVRTHEHSYQGPSIDIKSLNWRKINGPFVSIWLHNVPWGGEDAMAAPHAEFSDGCLDLIMVKDCPKLSLLKLMTELNNGGHVKSPHVTYLKVKAFVLQPGPRTDDPAKAGIIDVDGEVLARGKGAYKCEEETLMSYDKLFIKVDQGLATLFTPN